MSYHAQPPLLPPSILNHRKDKITQLQTIPLCVKIPRDQPAGGHCYTHAFESETPAKGCPPTCYQEQGKAAQSNRQEMLCASVALGVNLELTWKGPLVGCSLGVPLPLHFRSRRPG